MSGNQGYSPVAGALVSVYFFYRTEYGTHCTVVHAVALI